MTIKIGLCGFTMSAAEYFETFPVLEIQQTFYEPPALTTLRRWREQAPEGFEFTMKAWQLITHRATSTTYRRLRSPLTDKERADAGAFRVTPVVLRAWETSLQCARIVRATSILFQCPASFRPEEENLDNMRRFFAKIERPEGVRLLWEPRGAAWPAALVHELCEELSLTHVVDPFVNDATTASPTYWRLHGIGNHYHVYTDAELRALIAKLPPGETYVMFNNIPRVSDAQRFARMLR
ncbi:MAG TPA: DUF72 domain-containing protein [Thermoanaerobaculia bacterium]